MLKKSINDSDGNATKKVSIFKADADYFEIFSMILVALGALSIFVAIILGIFNKEFVSFAHDLWPLLNHSTDAYIPNLIAGIVTSLAGIGALICVIANNKGMYSFGIFLCVVLLVFAFFTSIFVGFTVGDTTATLPHVYFWMVLGGLLTAVAGGICFGWSQSDCFLSNS